MSQDMDNFLKGIASPKLRPSIYAVAEFIIKNKGKYIEEVAQNYIQSGMSKAAISIYSNSLSNEIGHNILKEAPKLLNKSRDELIKRAEERRIYLNNRSKSLFDSKENKWFHNCLKIDGTSELSRTKRILNWTNCLTEFYCEESLFKINIPKHSISIREEGEHPVSFREIKENTSLIGYSQDKIASRISFEPKENNIIENLILGSSEDMNKSLETPEEALLQELWEKGYLKCDLNR